MISLVYLIFFVFCDNIEISTSSFDEIHLDNTIIYSNQIKSFNWVKLSHLGNSIYSLEETKPRIFKIKDLTVYFKDKAPAQIRIDFEYKIFGIERFVYRFIIYNIYVSIFSFGIIALIFRNMKLFKKILDL